METDEPMVLVYATAPIFSFAKNTRELSIERINADVVEKHVFPVTGPRLDLMDQAGSNSNPVSPWYHASSGRKASANAIM